MKKKWQHKQQKSPVKTDNEHQKVRQYLVQLDKGDTAKRHILPQNHTKLHSVPLGALIHEAN